MNLKTIVVSLLAITFSFAIWGQTDSLPKKSIDGKEFYIYKVNNSEGFYSVGKKFNMTQDEIIQHNPSAQYGLVSGQELLIPVKQIKKKDSITDSTFEHTVTAGETLYAIANMYNVTPDNIIALNPGSAEGIRSGTILKIPQQKIISPPLEKTEFIYHTVTPKETLFSLSRKYYTTVESILQQNPGLSPSNFSIGKVIRIVPGTPVPQIEKPRITYQEYKVKKKETLYSIARKHNLDINDIIASNPGLDKLSPGDIIRIPNQTIPTEKDKAPSVDSIALLNNIYEKINTTQQKGHINIAIMLPFMLNKANDSKTALYIEYYEGFLLAVDSLKNRGASINVYAYDTENSEATVNSILKSPEMRTMDLIIGPVNDELIKKVSNFAQKNDINMVNSFTLRNDEVNQNPRIFQTNIPHPYLYGETAEEFRKRFGTKEIVFLTDHQEQNDKKEFIETLKSELKKHHISYKDFTFKSETNLSKLDSILNLTKNIIIIPTSGSRSFLSKVLSPLAKMKDNNPYTSITLFGYPEWQTYTREYLHHFHKLNTVIFTRFYANPTENSTKEFYKKYRYWYGKELINAHPKYGLLGYDTGLYFLEALYQYGKNFGAHIQNIDSKSLQTDFRFQRINNWSGFINKSIYFVNFKPNSTIHKTEVK